MSTLTAEDHLGLVHHVARKLSRTLAVEVELDELVGAGVLGLMQAVEAFDPARGFTFSTFAATRIRGAILDELRRVDPMPRNARQKWRRLHAVEESLTARLERAPTEEEIAEEMGVDLRTLSRWRRVIDAASPESLDGAVGIHASRAGEIERSVEHAEQVERVRKVLLLLRPQERAVFHLLYAEGLSGREASERLHLTQSRVSQIRKSGLRKLRARLRVP